MCWSAQADAVAGGVVAGLGVLCLVRARRAGRPQRLPLAALPLVLGAHQLIEALVWLGADGEAPGALTQAARTAWAVIALPLLPVLVPAGVWCAATEPGHPAGPGHRRALAALTLLGAAVAVPLAVAVAAHPVTATVHGRTLGYGIGVPHPTVLLAGYLLATVGSFLFSGDRSLRLLGLLTGVGAVLCALLWHLAFISTWCALAAAASLLLLRWAGLAPAPRPAPDVR
ncbi:DUF6629 family protein [Streptomyces rubellomurinus]|uniref:Integral membrane protein n=2 Tax=Streptomyces TaxID=1883 RepID=A0A0F2TCR5_STRR3|nr:DUF6629 family protein [Streptomyces rubellomurinus]KJS56566.1 hypothetical protein VM98_06490 [Streptomyces rubellomurinus subsp. indigoferus]KJS60939.1 hypothetical protein VM95_18190 [Streptomyces rubellomurinus]